MPILTLQKRMMELGRFRGGGERGEKTPGRKLEHWRITSASRVLLEAAAAQYGGEVKPWEGALDEGMWQVFTETSEVHGMFPPIFSDVDGTPTVPLSQFFEEWSGGGCQRRCDGVTEMLTGKPCLCAVAVAKDGEVARVCKPTTRLSFMIPDLPGLGVWRAESKGWNAAAELPATAQVLQQAAAQGKFIPMVLRLEQRTSKKDGQTLRFAVPVIDLPQVTVRQLAAGDVPLVLNPPTAGSRERPALPAGPEAPNGDAARFENDAAVTPEMGAPPPLPTDTTPAGNGVKLITEAQRRRLFAIAHEATVDEAGVKKVLAEVTGQESTKAIPRELYDAVIAGIQGAGA